MGNDLSLPPAIDRVAYETMQFFEIELPDGADPETYCDTPEAREHFAQLILTLQIDMKHERSFDASGNEV